MGLFSYAGFYVLLCGFGWLSLVFRALCGGFCSRIVMLGRSCSVVARVARMVTPRDTPEILARFGWAGLVG